MFLSDVYCIGGMLQFAPDTSLGFVNNRIDATGTLTRRVKVSVKVFLFGRLHWGTARECLEISWNVCFL